MVYSNVSLDHVVSLKLRKMQAYTMKFVENGPVFEGLIIFGTHSHTRPSNMIPEMISS